VKATLLSVFAVAQLCLREGGLAATLTVSTIDDSGAGSLRQAILDANVSADADTIAFSISGAGPHTLALASRLPDITQPLTMDGFTQSGASPNTLAEGNNAVVQIRLDGAGAFGANGLRLRAPGCVVRGLSITRFAGEGVQIIGASNCMVSGNFIGLAPDGTARANNGSGVQIFDTSGNRIGGTSPADRNVLSGNFTAGVHLIGVGASNNVVEGNFIGTSLDGTAARANFVNGIYVQDSPRNRIGGTTPSARNVISGNSPHGIEVNGAGSVNNVIVGNFIGPNVSGTTGLVSQNGVNIDGGSATRVGGSAAGEPNIISGNNGSGVRIGSAASGNQVLGNRIGVSSTGSPLSNGGPGIFIRGSGNRLGGISAGEGNEIANNAPGIEIELGTGNAIRGNSIHDNRPRFLVFGGLGIDLAPFGVTDNDAGDGDGGVNMLQNFPLLTAASASGGNTRVQGTLNSRPAAAYDLDFYSSPDCDASGHGEGMKYLGSTSMTTDDSGLGRFDVTLPVAAEGRQITATATDAEGNTSEFSPCFAASVVQPPQTFIVTNTNDSGPGSLRQALLDAQASPASANNVVAFNISPAAGRPSLAGDSEGEPLTIRLSTPLATIFEGVTIDGFTQDGSTPNTSSAGHNAKWCIRLEGNELGAGVNGLTLGAPGCVVRGLELSGFRGFGIRVTQEGDSSLIAGCHIAENQSGGLLIDNVSNVTIGGSAPEDRNVIHRNGPGVQISGAQAADNVVIGNWIGPDTTGAGGSGNLGEGVLITDSAQDNHIGGAAVGEGNRIAFNARSAVNFFGGTGNECIGNSIANNLGGIELSFGANGGIVPPAVTAGTILADGTRCAGTVLGRSGATYTIHAYAARRPFGDAEIYLGASTAVMDASGSGSFEFVANEGVFLGQYLAMTLTGEEGTSGLSQSLTPESTRPGAVFTVTTAASDGPGSLDQMLIEANDYLTAGNNIIEFNIAGEGVQVIKPTKRFTMPDGPITINGFTQPGSQPNTRTDGYDGLVRIQIDDANQVGGTAFPLTAEGSKIVGLSITRFTQGIELGGGGGHIIQGNLLGVDPSFKPAGNTRDAVVVVSAGNLIGGINPEDRNVVGRNGRSGILVAGQEAKDNRVQGNFIGGGIKVAVIDDGVDVDHPHLNLGNGDDGIRFRFGPTDTLVGGEEPGAGNLFGFNGLKEVMVEDGQRITILNNQFLVQPVPTSTTDFIVMAASANGGVRPPTLTSVLSDDLSFAVAYEFSGDPTETYQGQVYVGRALERGPYDLQFFTALDSIEFETDATGIEKDVKIIGADGKPVPGWKSFLMVTDSAGNSSAASALVNLIPAGSADLKTQLFVQRLATNGAPLTVSVVVTNCGPSTASNVMVVLNQCWNLQVIDIPAPGRQGTNEIYYAIGDLQAGESRTVTATLRPRDEGPQQLVAYSTHTGQDPDKTNDSESVELQVVERPEAPKADLEAEVIAPKDDLVSGDLVTHTFRISNNGPNDATAVQALIRFLGGGRDPLIESVKAPPNVRYTVTGNHVSCALDNVFAGGTVEIQVQARVFGQPNVDAGISSELKVWSGLADPETSNNVDFDFGGVVENTPLSIIESDGAYKVTWSESSPRVGLQSTTSLKPPVEWKTVPENLIVRGNGANTYTIQPQAPGKPPAEFYRLPPDEPGAEFNQVSLEVDGVVLPFTDWGQVNLTLPPSDDIRYVNVTYNDEWVIENVPIESGLTSDGVDKVSLSFPMETDGGPVFTGNTGFSISTNLATTAPLSTNLTFFGTTRQVIGSGEVGIPLTYRPPKRLVGGLALRTAQARPDFPNREQRNNECAPAAILNSLHYLDSVFGLKMGETNINLQSLKDAMRWTPAGAPVGPDPLHPDWTKAKSQLMLDRNLPIVTEVTTNALLALAAVRSMYDVEIRMEGHVACVVRVTELGNGRYALTLAHDIFQGNDGGNVREAVILDTKTGQISGTSWGAKFATFVIERPR
jgi:hypothetical protein